MTKYLIGAAAILVVALVIAAYWRGHSLGFDSGLDDCASRITKLDPKGDDLCATAIHAVVEQSNKAAASFKAQQDAAQLAHERELASIKATYQKELQDAKADGDRVATDLRAGNLKLRNTWECPSVAASGTGVLKTAASGSKPAAAADLRAASAGRIIGAGAECDAEVRALQRIVIEDRQ